MMKLIHAFFNMDTNSVELTYNDGSVLAIDCEEVKTTTMLQTDRWQTWIGCFTMHQWNTPAWCCPGKWRTT